MFYQVDFSKKKFLFTFKYFLKKKAISNYINEIKYDDKDVLKLYIKKILKKSKLKICYTCFDNTTTEGILKYFLNIPPH